MDDISKYLDGFEFWSHLSDEEKTELNINAIERIYPAGSMIFDSASECLGFVYVISGSLRTYMMSDEGKEVTLFRLNEGDSCVLSASCVIEEISFDSYMGTEEDTRLMIINASTVSRLSKQNIYFRCFTYELATMRFSAAMKTMDNLLFLKLEGRLASFLLSEYERTGVKEIKMTHEQVAQYINSAREVVARTLKRFVQDGLAEVKRGVIILKDPDGLKELI